MNSVSSFFLGGGVKIFFLFVQIGPHTRTYTHTHTQTYTYTSSTRRSGIAPPSHAHWIDESMSFVSPIETEGFVMAIKRTVFFLFFFWWFVRTVMSRPSYLVAYILSHD